MVSEILLKLPPGKPNRFDINNGIMAIYDHRGTPWIISLSKISKEHIGELVDRFHLVRGAYVPFSNDRYFVATGEIPSVGLSS